MNGKSCRPTDSNFLLTKRKTETEDPFIFSWLEFALSNPLLKVVAFSLILNVPEKLQLYGLHVYYVVHICDFGMLRINIS